MDLTIETDTFDPDSHFLFWKPGGTPRVEPDGMAWRLDPASDLVLNVHLQPSGKPETVQPSVGLYFTDKPPAKRPMLVKLENDRALDIPPGARDFLVSDDFRLPLDVDVLAVYPHAHYLGTLLEAFATLPDGSRRWLIRIPQWDVNWQSVYPIPHARVPAEGHGGFDAVPLRQLGGESPQSEFAARNAWRAATSPPTRWGTSGCRSWSGAKATGGPFCRKR